MRIYLFSDKDQNSQVGFIDLQRTVDTYDNFETILKRIMLDMTEIKSLVIEK